MTYEILPFLIIKNINKCTPVKLDGTVAHVTPTLLLGVLFFGGTYVRCKTYS
ncbi:protein of unknown function [Streptococcus thermophilus]|nr:protein of unknown function [Streptococcus thermophilus]CAD0158203.1 protein of unknown function [Streptococcus thermophilus]